MHCSKRLFPQEFGRDFQWYHPALHQIKLKCWAKNMNVSLMMYMASMMLAARQDWLHAWMSYRSREWNTDWRYIIENELFINIFFWNLITICSSCCNGHVFPWLCFSALLCSPCKGWQSSTACLTFHLSYFFGHSKICWKSTSGVSLGSKNVKIFFSHLWIWDLAPTDKKMTI